MEPNPLYAAYYGIIDLEALLREYVGDEVVKGPERAPELILIQNWADELTRIVRLP